MRNALSMALGLTLVFALALTASAEEKKEVTLKGTITCSKCDLKLDKVKCHTVIQVKEGDKAVVYYLDQKSDKAYHQKVCTEAKKGTVRGTVSEKDGKKIITATKIEETKKKSS